MMIRAAALSLLVLPFAAYSQVTQISRAQWAEMSEPARAEVQARNVVSVIENDAAGLIIDAQQLNASSPGSAAGSALGEGFASAAYFDNAVRQSNYSAVTHLAAALAGGLLGSALNTSPTPLFVTRYTVKTLGGQIKTIDQAKAEPFRLTVGLCVMLPTLEMANQELCEQRRALPPAQPMLTDKPPEAAPRRVLASLAASAPTVRCKIGIAAATPMPADDCEAANGEILK